MSNRGGLWTPEEETLLLEELVSGINIETMAKTHFRTVGALLARRKKIAFRMHFKGSSIDEIIKATKLSKEELNDIISVKNGIVTKATKATKSEKNALAEENVANIKQDVEILGENVSVIEQDIESMKKEMLAMKREMKKSITDLKSSIQLLMKMASLEE